MNKNIRFTINLASEIHAQIKSHCAHRHITMSKWVIKMIVNQLLLEGVLENTEKTKKE